MIDLMSPELQKFAGLISVHDGPIHPNDADCVALEYEYESGWLCGFKKGSQWVICTSGWSDTPEGAIQDFVKSWKERGDRQYAVYDHDLGDGKLAARPLSTTPEVAHFIMNQREVIIQMVQAAISSDAGTPTIYDADKLVAAIRARKYE